jgi:hypothetical protein
MNILEEKYQRLRGEIESRLNARRAELEEAERELAEAAFYDLLEEVERAMMRHDALARVVSAQEGKLKQLDEAYARALPQVERSLESLATNESELARCEGLLASGSLDRDIAEADEALAQLEAGGVGSSAAAVRAGGRESSLITARALAGDRRLRKEQIAARAAFARRSVEVARGNIEAAVSRLDPLSEREKQAYALTVEQNLRARRERQTAASELERHEMRKRVEALTARIKEIESSIEEARRRFDALPVEAQSARPGTPGYEQLVPADIRDVLGRRDILEREAFRLKQERDALMRRCQDG